MLYFVIAFAATLIGGFSGMGGGVIIKPALDALSIANPATINILSSVTVLTMSIVSVIKGFQGKLDVDKQLVILAVSGVVGGYVGNFLFSVASGMLGDGYAYIIQVVLNLILLIFCVFSGFLKKHNVKSVVMFGFVGMLLGALATFIGIGGGPINTALLVLVFGFSIKKAVIGSLFIIMFSQLMNVGTIWITTSFIGHDLTPLLYMIPAAIAGGLIGSILCKKLNDRVVKRVYNCVVTALIALNVYNLVVALQV